MNAENPARPRTRILFLIDFARNTTGGTEKHLRILAREIDRERFDCEVVGFDVGEEFSAALEGDGVPVHHLPVGRIYDLNALRQARVLRRMLASRRVDIVQTFHAKSDTYGVLVSRLAGVRHIISSRRDVGDRKPRFFRLLSRLTNRYCESFVTVCDAVGERLTADEGVPRPLRRTIYNGVDTERFRPAPVDLPTRGEIRRELGIAEDEFVAGMVAVFRPEKNFEVFLEAIRRARRFVPGLRALAVGAGPTLAPCREFCRRHDLDSVVIFPGRVRDVRRHIAALDAGCLTCGSNEGFSNAVLEQMAMGKPMVVTAVGGNAEAVTAESGFVVPPNDVDRIVEAIRFLYDHPESRDRMGREGRLRVESRFREADMVRQHEQLYDAVMNGAAGAERGRPARTGV